MPSPARLEAVALHLAAEGNHRGLITLVETWAEHAVPTVPARLATARSFVSLRMVDRAWVRLKDLVECADPNVEALQIAAQMFLLRGWQNQARKVVQLALDRSPGDPLLEALAGQAAEPPPELVDQVDDAAVSAELVRVAEQHMARGAFVRARTLLEKVRRRDATHARTDDLLWAIRGEFTSTESLGSMCERWAPPIPTDAGTEVNEFEEPEHTVSARVEDLRGAHDDRAFRTLFRNLDEADRDGDGTDPTDGLQRVGADPSTPEVTAVRSLGAPEELEPSFSDRTDHGEDTQIARVMRKGGVLQAIDTPMDPHRRDPGRSERRDGRTDGGFDLAAYRRQVVDAASDLSGPEDEDDSLVIRTGREAEPETSETGHDLSLDTRDERMAKAKQGSSEEAWAAPSSPAPAPRILGRPAAKSRPSQDAPTAALPGSPAPAQTPSAAARAQAAAADEEQTDAHGALRGVAAPDAVSPSSAPTVSAPQRRGEDPPAPDDADGVDPDAEGDDADGDAYSDDTEQDGIDSWEPPPPPIAWPYWFFGLTAALAFFMMLFFLVAVVSALL